MESVRFPVTQNRQDLNFGGLKNGRILFEKANASVGTPNKFLLQYLSPFSS